MLDTMRSRQLRQMILLALLLLTVAACGRIQNERIVGEGSVVEAQEGTVEGRFEDGTTQVTVDVSEPRVAMDGSEVLVTLRSEDQPIRGALVVIEGNMSHAGMEPVRVRTIEGARGEYRAPLYWSMGGEWLITVEVTLPDGSSFERTLRGIEVSTP